MLFIGGISQGRKLLNYAKSILCGSCGSTSPVSYTHLVSGIKAHYSPEEMVGKKVMAVSYTHLDVYKRQPQYAVRLHDDLGRNDVCSFAA